MSGRTKSFWAHLAAWAHGMGTRSRRLVMHGTRRVGVSVLLATLLLSGTLIQFSQASIGIQTAHATAMTRGQNTFRPPVDRGGRMITLPSQIKHDQSAPAPVSPIRPSTITMRPIFLQLDPSSGAHAVGSDKRLEISISPGTATPALVTKANGALFLRIVQLAGPSGGSNSGRVTLGTYQFALTNAQGQIVAGTLARPLFLTLHLTGWRGAAFDLAHVRLIIQPQTPGAKISLASAPLDAKSATVTAPMTLSSSTTTGTWETNSPNAQWEQQTDTTVDLPAGDLGYSYPIDVPNGPGGLKPNLTLAYSSGSVAGQHGPLSTSGWLGEGWDLSVGAISWQENNVLGFCTQNTCTSGSGSPGVQWQSSWHFADSYGNSGELIPPDIIDAPWYDDSGNAKNGLTAEPLTWHLSEENHVRVISYNNPVRYSAFSNTNFYPTTPPCFRAFLPSGTMEEFGCTPDSLQWYVIDGPNYGGPTCQSQLPYCGYNFLARWDLDMIVDANGNQIHFTYKQITNDFTINNQNYPFPIDAVLSSITYDSPNCHPTPQNPTNQTMCTGSNWQPSVQIAFSTDYSPARSTGASCPTFQMTGYYTNPQTMRCDDVPDLSESGGLRAPELQSLLVLNDITVQVMPPGVSGWKTVRDYQISYEQSPSTNTYNHYANPLTDPPTGMPEAISGYTDLTKITVVGDDNSTSLPPLSMSYTTIDEYYVDAMNPNQSGPVPSTNCIWWWNSGDGACPDWSQSFNARYLATLDNARGWHEQFTYMLARNNTHGVNSGNRLSPFACDNSSGNPITGSPCNKTDDENWSRVVLTQRVASVLCVKSDGTGCGSNGTSTLTSSWGYNYFLTDVTHLSQECTPNCDQTMYWGNQNDGDGLDYYNAHFMGFAAVNVNSPDGSLQVYDFYSTEGYGLFNSSVPCASFSGVCGVSPWTDGPNVLHGKLQEEDDYDTNGTTLLKQTINQYTENCPAPGVPPSPSSQLPFEYQGQLTSELDHNNPIVECFDFLLEVDTYQVDGGPSQTGTHTTTTYEPIFDGYGPSAPGHISEYRTDTTTNAPGSTPHIVSDVLFVWNDAIGFSGGVPTGTYIVQKPAIQAVWDDINNTDGKVFACTDNAYDGGTVGARGQTSTLVHGNVTSGTRYSSSCVAPLSGPITTASAYDANNGNLLATKDADAVAGNSAHTDPTDCTINSVAYSACAQFDSLYDAMPIQLTDALGYKTSFDYAADGSNPNNPDVNNGWGQFLMTATDVNNQVTAYMYDPVGRLTASADPGDTTSSPTRSYTYPDTCATTGAAEPCTALVTTQRLQTTFVTSATYYDGWGRPVETVTPENSAIVGTHTTNTFSVQYTLYDASGRTLISSDPYFVSTICIQCPPAGTPPPYFRPDTTQPHTSYTYDGLGRVLTVTDPVNNTTTTSYAEQQPQGANVNDTNIYAAVITIDANQHKSIGLSDGFGRTRYTETFLGNSNPYTLYGVTSMSYDYLGDVTSVTGPNPPPGSAGLSTTPQTTSTYDLVSRKLTVSDADLGTNWQFTYDQDGNVLSTSDPRGTSGCPSGPTCGAIYASYDGLDRMISRSTHSDGSSPYVTYSYDSTANGNLGKGQLTGEVFNPNDSLGGGSYSYTYDNRGRQSAETINLGGTNYSFAYTYDDADHQTSITYSDNEVLSYGYSGFGWLTSATLSGSVNLATNITYSGSAGAAMMPTGASVAGGTYTFSASYDNDLRVLTSSLAHSGTTVFASSRTYDPVGDVTNVNTTLAAGTDNQAFCYDELGRLTWAGSTGTPACTVSLTPGNLTAAQYTQTFSYDALDRLTSGPLGTYTYGPGMQASSNPSPLDAALAIGTGGTLTYTASYDAAGDMNCRAPTSATTCSGTPTGAALTYDAERRLTHWQNAQTNPTVSDDFRYDGEGNRVAQSSGGTITYYLGGLEEVVNGALIKYYPIPGALMAMRIGGALSYLAADGLSSVTEALDGSGNVTAAQLYTPYGGTRYTSGTMPTAYAFTGQRADAATGLDYYNARYYDPLAGQFASADDVSDGLNRFGYVHGNPTSKDDPSGHGFSCLSIGSAYSAPAKVAAIAGCALDSFAVGIGVSSGGIARSLISATLRTRASGTFEYLTGSAGRALQAATSGKAIFWNSLRSLKDPGNILPGRASTAADIALEEVKSIINDPANLRGPVGDPPPWGTNASRAFETFTEDTLPAYETTFKWIAKASKWLGAAGIALVGVAAGTDYYAHDSGDPTPLRIEKSVIAGVTHAGFVAVGAWVGGAVGGMIGGAVGGLCGPIAIVCSTGLAVGLASAGAWAGDWLAGKFVDLTNTLASNAANAISNWWSNL